MLEVDFSLTDAAKDIFLRLSLEGQVTRDHDVQNAAERPDVSLFVVLLLKHLRRHVVRGTSHLTFELGTDKFGKSKVN